MICRYPIIECETTRSHLGRETMDIHGSIQDTYYTSGEFLAHSSGAADATFKVEQLIKVLAATPSLKPAAGDRVADVGCGAGETTRRLAAAFPGAHIDGYDIHPQIDTLTPEDNIRFFRSDFCTIELETPYDLSVLFDVIEHVPDPISFVKAVALRSRAVAFHIPLDDSSFVWLRNLMLPKLTHPGHLVALSPATALTLVALTGVRTRTFVYSPVFRAPTGRERGTQRLFNFARAVLYSISPYLTQRLLGGVSLMVVAETPLSSGITYSHK